MNNRKSSLVLIILAILVIAVGGLFAYKYLTMEKAEQPNETVDVGTGAENDEPLVYMKNESEYKEFESFDSIY